MPCWVAFLFLSLSHFLPHKAWKRSGVNPVNRFEMLQLMLVAIEKLSDCRRWTTLALLSIEWVFIRVMATILVTDHIYMCYAMNDLPKSTAKQRIILLSGVFRPTSSDCYNTYGTAVQMETMPYILVYTSKQMNCIVLFGAPRWFCESIDYYLLWLL